MRVARHLSASVLVITGIAASTLAASPVAGNASTAATAGSAKNISLSAATQTQLMDLYAAHRGIAVSDISGVAPGMVSAAVVSPGGEDWAMITFVPAVSAPPSLDVKFQDGADTGVFSRPAGGAWKLAGLGGLPVGCSAGLPAAARTLWQLASCTTAATPPASASAAVPAVKAKANVALTLAGDIARSQVGISDNPAVTSFSGLDCNPFTAMEVPSASTSGCGVDSTYGITDASELWCADFAKWAWRAAGVTSDLSTLTASAASFYLWGQDHKESMPKDPADPQVGDAVIFYPGTKPNGSYADHVGIVSSIDSNGNVNLVDGDFLGSTNISVQYNDNIPSIKKWAAAVFGKGETWTFVSPELSIKTHSAAELVSAQSGKCLDTNNAKFANGTKEQIWECHKGVGQTWTYNSSGELTVDGGKYCVDVHGGKTANGSIVDLWKCEGTPNEQWTFGPGGTITGAQSGKCLNVKGEGTANGTQMIIWACNTAANEKWSWS
jgi:hypothetical protein